MTTKKSTGGMMAGLPKTESPGAPLVDDNLGFVRVLFDFKAESESELGLKRGEILRLLSTGVNGTNWWGGEKLVPDENGDFQNGYFPRDFVEICQAHTPALQNLKLKIEKRTDSFKSKTNELMSKISSLENQIFRLKRDMGKAEVAQKIDEERERRPGVPRILGISLPWLAGYFNVSRWRVFVVAMLYMVIHVIPSLRSKRLSGSTMYR